MPTTHSNRLDIGGPLPKNTTALSLQSIFALVVKKLELTHFKIQLEFVSAAQSKQINAKYAQNNYATDVLSFSFIEDYESISKSKPNQFYSGQVFICSSIAATQAKTYGMSLPQEIYRLFVHGLLHVCGYDHATKLQKNRFDRIQNGIISMISQEL